MVNAGGFVAYVARAFGPRAATATAMVTLLFYLASLVSFYAIVGVVAAGTFGWDLNPSIVSLAGLVIVGVLGYLGISVNVRLLVVLLAIEIIALSIVDVALLVQGGPEGYSLSGLEPSTVAGGGFGVALLLGMISYSGLEATVVFSEEARDPRRTIPRAVYVSLTFVAVFYALTSWLISVHTGPSNVQAAAGEDPGAFFFTVVGDTMGSGFTRLLEFLVISSFLALFIGFQSMISRYVFALARAGMLPSKLGVTSGEGRNPVVASVVVTLTLALVLGAFVVSGADPITVTYSWLVGLGTVGLLVVLAVVSAAILVFFSRNHTGENIWATRVAPAVALVAMLTTVYLAVTNYEFLGGATDLTAKLLLLLIPVAALVGWMVAGHRTSRGLPLDYTADLGG
jgi:amino acid transporter